MSITLEKASRACEILSVVTGLCIGAVFFDPFSVQDIKAGFVDASGSDASIVFSDDTTLTTGSLR